MGLWLGTETDSKKKRFPKSKQTFKELIRGAARGSMNHVGQQLSDEFCGMVFPLLVMSVAGNWLYLGKGA